MNVPNTISAIRLILVPIIIFLMLINPVNDNFYYLWPAVITINNYHLPVSWLIAGVLFIIAALSDFVDGWYARKFNQVTTFGKFFDAIADKMLVNGVLIVMACATIVPIWIVIILVLRDFLIDVVRQILASQNVIMAANNYGRLKAACEMVGMTLLFFVNWRFLGGNNSGHGQFDQYGAINQCLLILMYLATILSIFSAYYYCRIHAQHLFKMSK